MGDLPRPEIKALSLVLAGKFFTTEPSEKLLYFLNANQPLNFLNNVNIYSGFPTYLRRFIVL